MDSTAAAAPTGNGVDLATATAEQITDLFPDLGLFFAEDFVGWRTSHDGRLPDAATLVSDLGLTEELAATVVSHPSYEAKAPTSGTQPVATEASAEPVADPNDVEAIDESPASQPRLAEPKVEAAPAPTPKPPVTPPPLPPVDPIPAPAPVVEAKPPAPVVEPKPPAPVVEAKAEPSPSAGSEPAKTDDKHEDKAATPAAKPKEKRRFPVTGVLIGVLFLLNVAAIGGTLFVRREERRDVAPIAAISSGLGRVSAQEGETRAELETAKKKIVEQEKKIAAVARATDETAARQRAAEQEARERDARAAKELAAVTGRVSTLERRARDGAVTLSLAEALPVLDAASGAKSAAHGSPAPAATASAKPHAPEPEKHSDVHGPPRPPEKRSAHGH